MTKPLDFKPFSGAPLALVEFFALLETVTEKVKTLTGSTLSFADMVLLARIAQHGQIADESAARLVALGLIQEKGGDKSVLTETGRQALDGVITDILPFVTDLAKTVSAPDMIDTMPLLRRIEAYLDR